MYTNAALHLCIIIMLMIEEDDDTSSGPCYGPSDKVLVKRLQHIS